MTLLRVVVSLPVPSMGCPEIGHAGLTPSLIPSFIPSFLHSFISSFHSFLISFIHSSFHTSLSSFSRRFVFFCMHRFISRRLQLTNIPIGHWFLITIALSNNFRLGRALSGTANYGSLRLYLVQHMSMLTAAPHQAEGEYTDHIFADKIICLSISLMFWTSSVCTFN